ncbi:MAG: N-6 DNA methylase, partial [Enterococcus faecalis]|nr:N-6 DNA methylase [Enterococcus faecalis]
AADFVYGWQRTVDPKTGSQYAYALTPVANASEIMAGKKTVDSLGIKAESDTKLVITLATPTPYFNKLLTLPAYYPVNEAFVKKMGNKYGTSSDTSLYNGAFKFVKGKNQNKSSEENIQKILETYAERKGVEKYAHLATFDEIKENDYNLNIPRYVDTFEEEEPIDMVHVGNDIKKIRQEQHVLEKELLEAISSLQTTPENEAWLQGALEVFKHEQ